MNIAAYCRVSTDKADQLNSLEAQKEFFSEYTKRTGDTLVRLYADEGISGTKIKNRKEFLRMMADAEHGLFDMVVVKDISRFARNTVDLLQNVRKLKSLGIETQFLTANMTSMGNSEFVLTIFGALAQEESANTSKRVKFGKKMNAEKGRVPNIVYGYDKTIGDYFNLAINEEEAAVVRQIYEWYIKDGYGAAKISIFLNERGLRTKRNCQWSQNGVCRILTNELYTGKIINGKQEVTDFLTGQRADKDETEWMVVERPDLRIIEPEVFEQAQQIMQSRGKAFKVDKERQSNKYLFSTLIKCKECGWSFRRTVRTYKNTYVRWVCSGHNGRGADNCPNAVTVDEEELIEVLQEYFAELLKAKKNVIRYVVGEFQRVYKAKDENLNYEKELNAQLAKLQKTRQKYMDMYADDLISREELNDKIGGMRKEIERLENELKMVAYHLTKGEQLESVLGRTFKEIEDITDVHQMTNAQLKRIIQKIEVDKDGNVDIYLRLLGDLGLDETVLIRHDETGGDDTIVSSGGGFAGIGGPNSSSQLNYTGTIKIESGIVNAYGFGYGAGIGGGDYSSGGTIQISGGKVTAINGGTEPDGWSSSMHKQASGIGGSQGMDSGLITISGDAEVKAYGGYACAGIGGGTNAITITGNAKVTAYGGEKAAGIGGYDQKKGESTITISGLANVTAYGGKYASGLGQGSASAPVKLSIGSDAVITAYSDGRKAAITGTPQEGSASIINMYANDINLGTQNVPLTLTADDSNTQNITLAGGYKGIGTTCAAGNYTVTAPAEQEGSRYRLIPADGKSFKVAAASDNSAYQGTKLMLMLVSDNGTTIQLNPTSGTTIQSGNDEPLVLDEENGVIIVPAGGSVNGTVWLAGGTVAKNGTQKVNVESIALNENTLTLYTNRDPKTATLTATVSPDNATDKTVAWTSADEKVATVENGVVTAVGNGTTTITAQAGEKTATCVVTVRTYSSGGGSSSPSYSVTAPGKTENGTVTVSPRSAEKGETVTVTVKPDSGYTLETLTVTDKNGKELKLTDKGDGKYTFTMPSGKVNVKATFMEDNSLLNFFYDVPNDAYYFEPVKWAVEKNITTGVGNNLFAPNGDCTRAQIVTFLWRAAGSPEPKGTSSFTDISSGSYYAKAVAWAVENGITEGTGNGQFSPDKVCTRAQAVTFLFRALSAKAASAANFSDVPANSYYADAVGWAAENGVTEGIGGGKFAPNNDCTRAQIVTFLFRAYQGK